jgi:DNA (cytosine-5)-methyltransferase 1
MTAYYNEFDPKAAAWLRQLIKNGDIADGTVDERSIIEVEADDLNGFTQHHFFAGIGVWSYALRNAGWGDDRPVATASLPCQPFSAAGNQKGQSDDRHLLPHFLELVGQCNFHTIFGEQVEGAIKHGWLDDLYTEMENQDYTVGSAIIGAHSIGKPHIRKRIYWVAQSRLSDTQDRNRWTEPQLSGSDGRKAWDQSGGNGSDSGVAQSNEFDRGAEQEPGQQARGERWESSGNCGINGIGMANSDSEGLQGHRGFEQLDGEKRRQESAGHVRQSDIGSRVGNSQRNGHDGNQIGRGIGESKGESRVCESERSSAVEWLYCRDQKYRPIKPGIKPLVDGIARGVVHSSDSIITPNASAEARTIRLKGYGNAIVAPVAEEFIRATMEVINQAD